MRSLKILLGLTSLLTILAISATPASAVFNGGSTSQGPYQLEAGTSANFTSNGNPLKCEEVANGVWHNQVKTETGTTKIVQAPANEGPHQAISGQFTKCNAEVAGLKTPVRVNPTCELQLEQPNKGETVITDGVISTCTITIPLNGCVIAFPAGKPNLGLSKVTVANITGGVKETAEEAGITSTVNKPCEEIGITGDKTFTLKAIIVAHNAKLV